MQIQEKHPKISVISIALRDVEFEPLRRALSQQTYRDFEFVTSTKGNRAEALNDAILKAQGEFLLFIESDALPLNQNWLEDLSRLARKGSLVKGIEIRPFGLNLSNLICDADVFGKQKFNESFSTNEDTEMFARLRSLGIPIEFADVAPVVHSPWRDWRETLTRALRDGMIYAWIAYKYGVRNLDSVNTQYRGTNKINPISNRLRTIVENLLVLAGIAIGSIVYLPVLVMNRRQRNK